MIRLNVRHAVLGGLFLTFAVLWFSLDWIRLDRSSGHRRVQNGQDHFPLRLLSTTKDKQFLYRESSESGTRQITTARTESKNRSDLVTSGFKVIALGSNWYGRGWNTPNGTARFKKCSVSTCFIYDHEHFHDEWLREHADAIVFHFRDQPKHKRLDIPEHHPSHQIWIFYMNETPVNTYRKLSEYRGLFNWTMTYRSDSDILTAHSFWLPNEKSASMSLNDVQPGTV